MIAFSFGSALDLGSREALGCTDRPRLYGLKKTGVALVVQEVVEVTHQDLGAP